MDFPRVDAYRKNYLQWWRLVSQYFGIAADDAKRVLRKILIGGDLAPASAKYLKEVPILMKLAIEAHEAAGVLAGDAQYTYLANRISDRPSPTFSRLSYISGATEEEMLKGMKETLATRGFEKVCNMFDGCVVPVNESACSVDGLAASLRRAICMDVAASPFTSPRGYTADGSVRYLLDSRGIGHRARVEAGTV